ncbi:methyl-accepting chemotaxis protein [Spirulina sp. CS-785/01]|uniref:methyl-accepting chemotaxis protein n=1 Tax=Spirulina sp. CS-785/01 TaxID=3021716 RepID=UPI00232F6F4E|nr:methyl-accepting chemotaxis protein [Spirulina sp. CS-785/01]MDB9313894.1 methyl-accepting chemotaxis protein [Spirulina sp. CS-785/01]
MHNFTTPQQKIPQKIIIAVTALCIVPFFLNQLGLDFATQGVPFDLETASELPPSEIIDAMHLTLAGSFVHTILEWSAFCAAFLIVLLSLLNYTVKGNPMTPILGVALFFAGVMDAFHTLAADRLIEAVADHQNLIPFTWAICRLFHALIMIVGVGLFLISPQMKERTKSTKNLNLVIIISFIFGVVAYSIIYFCATSSQLPQTMFPNSLITRPWDVIPLLLFLFAGLVVYPKFYHQESSIFTHAVVISAIPNVATQVYMAFGSTALFDNAFNIAHFLKILAYLVPLIGLSLDYVNTYQSQARSLSADLKQSLAFLRSLANKVLDSTQLTNKINESGQQLESMVTQQVAAHRDVLATTTEVGQISEQLVETVEEIESAFTSLQKSCKMLSEQLGEIATGANNIHNIIDQINYIATQTKMLSLNASIEASKVGNASTGFTVIAKEINKLADETANITEKINPILD